MLTFKSELVGLLAENKVPVKPAFDPTNADILGDPKIASRTAAERKKIAQKVYSDRMLRTCLRLPHHLGLSIVRAFTNTIDATIRLPASAIEQYLAQRLSNSTKPASTTLSTADFQPPVDETSSSDADLAMDGSGEIVIDRPVELFNVCIHDRIDILLVTETYLTSGQISPCPWTQVHNYAQVIDTECGLGGLFFFYRPDLPFHVSPLPIQNPDTLSLRVGPYVLRGLYLAPGLPPEVAQQRYHQLNVDDYTLLLGDFNIRLAERTGDARGTPSRRAAFEEWIDNHGLTIWNAELAWGTPTFDNERGQSIIDYFLFTRPQFLKSHLEIRDDLDLLQSDHHLCQFTFLPASTIPPLPSTNAVRQQWRLQRLADPKVKERYVNITSHPRHALFQTYG
ncbi:hypothetical protein EC973_006994 [Apophysomyces ossiformis]|uniref:Endonuclease/exonuclease/phosphatase domain-containing protein n=1 Tax=Apophysomyces ossiformis TaxID=679940 RepID=A0A8H7BNC9_9FUNG|nr:hypothetical protein EC973_006994 [Apophysomyces ossiformis]